jgi:hypothetical protein
VLRSWPSPPRRRACARASRTRPHRDKIETMYLDKLDGRITATFFDEKAALWR